MRWEGETSEHDTDLIIMQGQKKGSEVEEEESQPILQFQESLSRPMGHSKAKSCLGFDRGGLIHWPIRALPCTWRSLQKV